MTTDPTPYDAPPSEVLTPDQLDQALLTLVVRRDGSSSLWLASDVNRDALAEWMRRSADEVAAAPIECAACREGRDHTPVTE